MFVDWKNILTKEDIVNIVTELGSKPPKQRNETTLVFETICHNEPESKKSFKMYYYHGSKTFHCFTACNETFDIYGLVGRVFSLRGEELSFLETYSYVNNFMGVNKGGGFKIYSNSEEEETDLDLDNIELQEYDGAILNNLPHCNVLDWNAEGISFETLVKYGIKYYSPLSRIVIPHYDKNSRLIGIRGRTCLSEDAELYGKYMPLFTTDEKIYGHPLGMNLYGIHLNKDNIQKKKIAILFEGEKSVMIADGFMKKNICLAVCGSNISKQQANLLLELGVEEVVLAFDREYEKYEDEKYYTWEKNIFRVAEKFGKKCKVSVMYDKCRTLSYKDSPIDKGQSAFKRLYRNREIIFDKEEENEV